jgi:hypothetical protein
MLHQLTHGSPFELNINDLSTDNGKKNFIKVLQTMRCGHLPIATYLSNLESESKISQLLNRKTECVIRFYVVSAFDLASRDSGSHSDPYLKLSIGK